MISGTQQHKNLLAHNGNLLILGGPGSGKTTAAILKAKELIPSLEDYQKILFLSFSNGAIFQVRQRAGELLTKDGLKLLHVQTYHSFCFSLIKSYGMAFGVKKPAQIFPPEEKKIIEEMQLVTDIETYLENQCFDEGRICFEKMPQLVNTLLGNKQVLSAIQSRYPVIIIDEFQDSIDDEWYMLQKIGAGLKVIALADIQQRIYAWRPGSSANRIQEFQAEFEPLTVDFKEANYRSPTSRILEYADNIRDSRTNPHNPSVRVISYIGSNDVSFHLKNAILELRKELRSILGRNPTIAVLSRTNVSALYLSSELNKRTGRISFPINHELLLDPDGLIVARRVIGRMLVSSQDNKGILASVLEELGNFCLVTKIQSAQAVKERANQLFNCAHKIRDGQKVRLRIYVSALPEIIDSIRNGMTGNIEEDWNLALEKIDVWANERFPTLCRYLNGVNPFYGEHIVKKLNATFKIDGYKSIMECLNTVHQNSRMVGGFKPKSLVTVMTMHKSKGKEYDAVILFDHYRSHPLMLSRQSETDNRLLVRVAITRARHRVNILHARDNPPHFLI